MRLSSRLFSTIRRKVTIRFEPIFESTKTSYLNITFKEIRCTKICLLAPILRTDCVVQGSKLNSYRNCALFWLANAARKRLCDSIIDTCKLLQNQVLQILTQPYIRACNVPYLSMVSIAPSLDWFHKHTTSFKTAFIRLLLDSNSSIVFSMFAINDFFLSLVIFACILLRSRLHRMGTIRIKIVIIGS